MSAESAPPEEDFGKLPLEELVVHKSWKARQLGYSKAATLFEQLDSKDAKFGNFLGIIKKFVEDSNVLALEKGLDAVLAFVDNAAVAPKTAGEVCPIVVQKSLGNTKTKIRDKAQELMLMYVEIEKQDVVIESLIAGLQNKNPKAVSACVSTISLAVNQFGARPLGGVKNIACQLASLLENKDKDVREQAKILAIELYRWVGPAFMPLLANLKPIQKSELETEFETVKTEGSPVPCRFLRSQRSAESSVGVAGTSGEPAETESSRPTGPVAPEPAAVDPWEFLTPVDVLAKLPPNFYDQVDSKKWSERKEPLDNLAALLKDQRLDTKAQYGEIVSVLKRIIGKDSNIQVVACAGSCLTRIALGLRKKFANFAPMVAPVILEKFKEKKPVVLKSMTEAIDAVATTTTLESLVEDIVAALDNKSPTVKIQTALFLSRLMSKVKKDNVPKKVLKALTTSLIKNITDPDAEVREAAAAALGAAMKMAGEKAFLPFISEIAEDHLKMDKIKEFYTKAMEDAGSEIVSSMVQSVHKTLDPGAPTKTAAPAAATRPPGRRSAPVGRTAEKSVPGKAPLKVQKAAAKTRASSASRGGAPAGKKPLSDTPKVPDEPEISKEEAEERAAELFAEDARTELDSAQWKDRLTGMEKIFTAVKCMPSSDVPTQVIVRLLNRKKENNFQVLNQKLEVVLFLAKNCPFPACCLGLILGELLDKIFDSKHAGACKQILSCSAEALSLKHVTEKVSDSIFGLKNPKCQSESLLWMAGAVREFGLDVDLKQIMDVNLKALSATNPAVRMAAVELAGVLYLFFGAKLRSFFEGEKATLLQTLDGEFQKYEGQSPPAPVRKWKLSKEKTSLNPAGGDNAGEEEAEEDTEETERLNAADLLPRKDISSQITDQLLDDMCNPAWKTRGEALDRVQGIVSEAKFITADLGGLPEALRARLGESNKNLAQVALAICESLPKAVGPRIKIHVKTIGPGIIGLLGDGKPTIRQNAANCLNCWVEQCGLKEFLDGEILPTALKKTNPILTSEMLKWLIVKMEECKKKPPQGDLKMSLPYLFSSLEDRNPDVRKNSQDAIVPFMKVLGYECMQRHCADLKPPSNVNVQTVLDRARAQCNTNPTDMESEPSTARSDVTTGRGKETPGSQSAASRGRSSSRKPGESGRMKKDEESFEGGALIDTQQKAQRFQEEKSMKILKWQFATPTEELVEQLKTQLSSVCKPGLLIQIFHSDFKQHLKALDALSMSIELCPAAVLGASDLLLKWCTLRFFDTNPSVLLKCLDFVKQLQQLQLDNNVELHDYEAASFVPYLLLKAILSMTDAECAVLLMNGLFELGEPKEMVRTEVRDILEKFCSLYPSSKLFPMVLEGLKTKNSRQKGECLTRMAAMIELYGVTVCGSPQQALKLIAQSIGDRDKDVRNGALSCLVAAYMHIGEKVYKCVGNISEKDLVMLEERIKRSTKNRPLIKKPSPPEEKRVMGRGGTPVKAGAGVQIEVNGVDRDSDDLMEPSGRKSRPRNQGKFQLNYDEFGADSGEGVEYKMPKLIDHSEVDQILNEPVQMPQIRTRGISPAKRRASVTSVTSLGSVDTSSALDNVISQVTSSSIVTASQALAQLDELVKEGKCDVLTGKVDQILTALYFQLRMAYSTHMEDDTVDKSHVVDLYRSIGAMLLSLLQFGELAREASEGPLKDLACQLLTVLLDERLPKLPEGVNVVKSINLLIVKLVEKTDATVCLVALIRLMRETLHSQTASSKFQELVMKCIWRHSRRLSCVSDSLQLSKVLVEAHLFFADFPTASWKQRNDDTALRTIKTVLNTLVRTQRDKILDHVGGIENPQNSEMVAYLKKCLRDAAKNPPPPESEKKEPVINGRMARSSGDILTESTNKEGTTEPQLPGAVPVSEKNNPAAHGVLAQIFKKIGDKENSKEGIKELYQFKRTNPNVDVSPYMKKASPFFREYIDRSLKQVETERWALSNNSRPRGESPEVTGSMPSAYLEKLQQVRTRCGLGPSEVTTKRNTSASDDEVTLPQVRTTAVLTPSKSDTSSRPSHNATTVELDDLKRRLDMIKRQQ